MKAMYWTRRFFLSYQSNFVPDFFLDSQEMQVLISTI